MTPWRPLHLLATATLLACSRPVTTNGTTPAVNASSGAQAAPSLAPDPPPPPTLADAAAAARPVAATPQISLDSAGEPSSWKMATEALPAISADGKTVALFVQKEDGLRGFPNHGIAVVNVDTGKTVTEISVLIADEIGKASTQASDLKKRVAARLVRARSLLTREPWRGLEAWRAAEDGYGLHSADSGLPETTRTSATLAATEISFAGRHLRAKDASGKTLLERAEKGWEIEPYKAGQPGAPMCRFEPYVDEIAVDQARTVLVVRVGQAEVAGGDSCNEQSQYFVFRLNGTPDHR